MDSRSNVAVVECEYWGKNLVRNFHKLGNLKVLCDVSDASLSALASQYGVEACNSYDEVLARPDIAAVAIATPAAQHHAMVRAALIAGKDVFVEKPLALQLSEGEELVEIARQRQRVLMVGHLLYYHPAIRKLKELIRKGALGRVEYVYSARLNFGKLRTEENILWSFAPHDISAILYKIQNNVSVYAGVELENDVFCGPSMVFTNVMNPRSHVNRKNEYQRTLVRQSASLGANSTIVCGTTIGEYAFVGAGAVVTRDVPDYALMVGTPARRIGWMCRCGVRLDLADGHGQCVSCGQSYLLDGEQLVALAEVPMAAAGGKAPLSQLHAPSR
ncbi:MAG TPA: Gfo/Idh/MocA family oxidoreductase [Candidatus Dormibacteraeota bacterium]|nr:Gfo/Idh/MocA family oxidoreductase [Candidatus Dormibacteraeota bacterium]